MSNLLNNSEIIGISILWLLCSRKEKGDNICVRRTPWFFQRKTWDGREERNTHPISIKKRQGQASLKRLIVKLGKSGAPLIDRGPRILLQFLASDPWKSLSQLHESLERRFKAHYFFIHGLWLPFSFDLRKKKKGPSTGCGAAMHNGLWIPPTQWMKGGVWRLEKFIWKKEKASFIFRRQNMTEWGRAPTLVSLYHHLKCAKLRLVEASPWRFSLLWRAIPLFR